MENIDTTKSLAHFFLLSLAWSLVLFSPIANSKLTGSGLIKLLSNTAIGSLVISIIVSVVSGTTLIALPFILKVLALASLILTTSLHRDEKSLFMWLLYLVINGCLAYNMLTLVEFKLLESLFILSASFLLGAITYSMLLGHWYLVVPKLSAHPLKVAAIITWIVLGVKIVWSSYSIVQNLDFFEEQTLLGAGYSFNWMLLTMRMSFGYLVILGMSFFNWKLLKLRSIQSSTGILYAMTFFVFIGEMVSMFMFYKYGLFI
jgi:hypothetical protein